MDENLILLADEVRSIGRRLEHTEKQLAALTLRVEALEEAELAEFNDVNRGLVPKELIAVRHDAIHAAAERRWECLIGPNATVVGTREERIDDIRTWIEEELGDALEERRMEELDDERLVRYPSP
jgi:hypothetical protein